MVRPDRVRSDPTQIAMSLVRSHLRSGSRPTNRPIPDHFPLPTGSPVRIQFCRLISMRWLKGWCAPQIYANRASRSGSTWYHIFNNGNPDGVSQATTPRLIVEQHYIGRPQNMLQNLPTMCRRFGQSASKEEFMNRDWLAQLWRANERGMKHRRRRKQLRGPYSRKNDPIFESPFYAPFMRSIRSTLVSDEGKTPGRTVVEQTPMSRSVGGFLSPSTPEEVQLAPLLARGNLVIVRDIEWANIMLAFEQESRYAIMDACYPESPVGFISEKSNVIFRQLLRTRRPFIASITDALGNEIFRVRRPFWLINSSIYAEVDGKEVGVVHRRWHLWRRVYDLYLGDKQFAVVENPGFWNWTFTLKDDDDNVLAQIDRDWRGLGLELFTDAGQYVIRFGDADSSPKSGQASAIEELEVVRPLTLSERAVAVALAISLDSDYFSRRGGWGLPILIAGE